MLVIVLNECFFIVINSNNIKNSYVDINWGIDNVS